MQVSVETTSGLERRLIVGVPAARVDGAVDSRLQKAAKTVKLDGFRPGKVPMSVVRQRFGQSVRMEVLGEVMNECFYEAIQQQELKPAGRPEIEPKSLEAGKDIEFVATFEVFPEIEAKDYSSIVVKKPVAEITAADVDKMIENLRSQRADWSVVERAAADGDKVNIDYLGTKDGVEFEGGKAEGSDLELGSGRMIPGFEAGIEGMA
ncbi:MAG: trigger factor, partial [Zhongshania aliphaticivorans]